VNIITAIDKERLNYYKLNYYKNNQLNYYKNMEKYLILFSLFITKNITLSISE